MAEAFKCYDPQETGFVDLETLRVMFTNLGFGDVTDEDLQILLETGDSDGDGRISLADFRGMVAFNEPDAPTNRQPEDGVEGEGAGASDE